MKTENTPVGKVLRASESRRAAGMLNIGNIVAILLPVPLLIFWFGASMLVYAMNRHHPDKRVGHYTQQAAYRLYGVTGASRRRAATFIPGGGWTWYIVAWVAAALVLIPWSVLDLRRIRREDWADIILPEPRTA